MNTVVLVRSRPGSGFYEVGRVISHVIGADLIVNSPLKLVSSDSIIFVGSIYGSILPSLISIVSRKKVILYVTAEGPFKVNGRSIINNAKSLIITPSHYSKTELISQGIVVHGVLPHGIDVNEVRNYSPVNPNTSDVVKIIAIVGDEVYKVLGAMFLLKAFANSPFLRNNARLILKVSSYPVFSTLKHLITNLGISDKVEIIIGYLTKSKLYSLLNNADIYAHVSLSDAFGLPIIESGAVGTPAVALNAPPWNEVINENVGFLVRVRDEFVLNSNPPYRVRVPDIQDLKHALEDATSHALNGSFRKFRVRVRDYVLNNFNAHKLYIVFKDLLSKR